ncbi:MAG: hypothetical protein V7633_63, partial [Pseudonocardia sp.]
MSVVLSVAPDGRAQRSPAEHDDPVPSDAEEPTRIDRLEAIIEINRSLASTLDADAVTHR